MNDKMRLAVVCSVLAVLLLLGYAYHASDENRYLRENCVYLNGDWRC